MTAAVRSLGAGLGGSHTGNGPVPRLALSKVEAAEALGVSVDFLDAHVMGELRVVYRGRRRLIPVVELERWLAREAVARV